MPVRCAALAAACVVAALAAFAAPAIAAPACAGADALKRAHLLTEAAAEYAQSDPGCGKPGAATVKDKQGDAAELVARAKRDEEANRVGAARDLYASAANIDASSEDAADGVNRMTRVGEGRRCEDAKAFEKARLLERAEELFIDPCGDESAAERVTTARAVANARLDEGDVDIANGRLGDARAAYADAFAADASLSDAQEKLISVVAENGLRPCANADALAKAKLLEQAQDAYADLQAGAGSPPCAVAGLATVTKARDDAATALKAAQKFEKDDEFAAARDEFEEAATADASLREARDGLERVAGAEPSLPERGESALEDAVPWLALIAGIAILLALFGAVLLRLMTRWWSRRVWWAYDDARRPASGRTVRAGRGVVRFLLIPVRWATRVGMVVEDLEAEHDDKLAKALTGALQAALPRTGSSGRRGVDAVAAPLSSANAFSEFSDALGALPQAKIWAALIRTISRLFPRETIKLTGHLRDTKYAMSMSLALSRADGAVIESVTISATEFVADVAPPTKKELSDKEIEEAVTVLARAGAAWAAFAYLEFAGILSPKEWNQQLGTRSWKSYALSQEGTRVPGDEEAHNLFSRARDADVGNPVALFNFASAEFRLDRGSLARELARQVAVRPVPKPARIVELDPMRVRVAYLLGSIELHRRCERDANTTSDEDDHDLEGARKKVFAELFTLERALARLRRGSVHRGRAALKLESELVTLEEPLIVLWAALDHFVPGDEVLAIGGGKPVPAAVVVEDLVRIRVVSARTHYNLACYQSIHGDERKAVTYLRRAVHERRLRAWAQEDPTLAWLRSRPSAWKRAMIPLVPAAPKPEGLAAIDSIGDHATALERNGISTEQELVQRARSPANRMDLADK